VVENFSSTLWSEGASQFFGQSTAFFAKWPLRRPGTACVQGATPFGCRRRELRALLFNQVSQPSARGRGGERAMEP
jgi:hypothetical protein